MSSVQDRRWWLIEDEADLARAVTGVARALIQEQGHRSEALRLAARMHGDSQALGIDTGIHALDASSPLNFTRIHASTALSDLISGPTPRPMFATSGGDFETQERAKALSKFCGAVMYDQGFDQLAQRVALHSAVFGVGIVKVVESAGRPALECCFPWEVWADERDAQYGSPRQLIQTRWVDRAILSELYPDSAEDIEAVTSAVDDSQWVTLGRDTLSDQVQVVEAWRLPTDAASDDGRHAMVVGDVVLVDERWSDASFPFAFLRWSPGLGGIWSAGIAQEVLALQLDANDLLDAVRQCVHFSAVPRVFVAESSKIAPAQLTNGIGSIIRYAGGSPPIFHPGSPIPAELKAQLEWTWSKSFQVTGVSEMSASAMRPAGLNSGKAIRVHSALQSKRFSVWQKAFAELYVETARLIVRLMERLAEDNPEAASVVYRDAASRAVERIDWASCRLDESEYVVQVFPVSALSTDPEGRLEDVQDLLQSGLLSSPAEGRQLLGMPDTEASDRLANATRLVVEYDITLMLHRGVQAIPEGMYDLSLTLHLVTQHYLLAKSGGVSDDRLELMRQYLLRTQALMTPPPEAELPPDAGMEAPQGGPPPDAAAGPLPM